MPKANRSTYKERCALASRIKLQGVEMFPCTNCQGSLKKCYVSMGSKSARCNECVKSGLKCDVRNLPVSDWAAIEREESRVAAELAETTAKLHEMLARQSRLMKQQEFVRTRAKEMLQRGLDNLDELDAAEEEEQRSSEFSVSTGEAGVSSSALPALSPGSWDQFFADAGVEMPTTTLGS